MDILFIDPPYMSLKGIATDCGYNVGLTNLAAYLRKYNVENVILSGDLLTDLSDKRWTNYDFKAYAAAQTNYESIVSDKSHVIWKTISEYIVKIKPGIVGISYYTPLKSVVEKIARLTKEISPDIVVIAGAFHPTFCPEDVMRNQNIDFAVSGEGELSLLDLIKAIKTGKKRWQNIPGVYYREDGKVYGNRPGGLIENLDDLPFMARDLVINCDYNIYRDHCMSSTRGCPYTCSFCGDKGLWGGRVRRRSVNKIVEEFKLISNTYNVNQIDLVDGTFTYDKQYIRDFCNALINEGIPTKWRCTARYDNLDEDILKILKKANCLGFYFGLESGSSRVLKAVNKKTTVEEILEVDKMVYDYGFFSATSVLLGLPDETKEDLQQTLDIMRKVKTTIFDVNSYVPLPGTSLYNDMDKHERENIDWNKIAMKSLDNHFSKTMTLEEFRHYLLESYEIANDAWKNNILGKI
jgi:anaerobic magnesium-protoporphyrin IX monomethyl ester cyclase